MDRYIEILRHAIERWNKPDAKISNAPEARELSTKIDLSLSAQGADESALIEAINQLIDYSPRSSHKGFFKLLYSGVNKEALLGDWITSLVNSTMHTYQVGPISTLMELELIKQWNALVGFNNGDGVMVSGGSQANQVSMLVARHQTNSEIKRSGLSTTQASPLRAYVSVQAHYSYERAVNILGIGSDNLVKINCNESGQMCIKHLAEQIQQDLSNGKTPFYIGLTAGTTVIGAFDNVAETSAIARANNCWLHIDGAWGAPVLFSTQHKHLLQDSDLADSFAWDAHKLINVPITAAVILLKKAGLLQEATAGGGGDYLFHNDSNAQYNLGQRSIQCGRRADAIKVWLSWKAKGNNGFAEKVDSLMQLKKQCLELIKKNKNLELLAPAAYLNVLFRYSPSNGEALTTIDSTILNELNKSICKRMMSEGEYYVDYAQFDGKTGIRLILANQESSESDVLQVLNTVCRIGRNLT